MKLLLAVAVLPLTGCADDTEPQAEQRSPNASPSTRSPSPATPPAASVVTTPPATTPAPQAAPQDELTGYGATRDAWDRAHEQAPGYTPGSAYLPFVRDRQPRYAAVTGDDQILSYSYFFRPGTTLQAAMDEVLRGEFPAGAKYGRVDRDEPHCVLVEVLSPPVERVMATDGAQYRPLIGFFSEPPPEDPDAPLNPSNVDNAILTVVEADGEKDLGMC